ncbi:hypothetical protein B0S90_2792 [Caldicellulosiruptor bescii]|uniref:Uncharacterized protein n=2 Tax=Caldicellulosiruptor bescii TaxID=31899 RepID=B9MNI7_CALBD|nr:hypothetical protein [Caldicellulosiruptor bescii]ACM61518.1 conserved hypothetical protein [Caldicellulosiruptor bescii DSM 6725]PBC88670.1 hypothetical protein B0S87_1699 [Caldicellulosiruptor bescii]PBC91849.1 hypothetical protein B0S89_2294 [Caldicellulosiruptor bescii]PBD02740.1 hypothetical protein B0S85_0280 [Caldicellulosiruptor bescii]PBD07643.1 hypothetical protein B0S90_2792 [Caldicellulosiruptor bescii]
MNYIVFKLLGLNFVIEAIVMPAVRFIFRFRKMGIFFSYFPALNRIVQDIKWRDLKTFKKLDCIAEREKFKETVKEAVKSSLAAINKANIKRDKVIIRTNRFVHSIMEELRQEGVLEFEKVRKYKTKRQVSEKLQLVSTAKVYKYLLNKKFWQWILRKEEICVYEIHLPPIEVETSC